jgi:hypothetical protein
MPERSSLKNWRGRPRKGGKEEVETDLKVLEMRR